MLNLTNVWIADTEFDGSVKRTNLESIFSQLATHDEDFNGNNGEEYLWEVAKEKGFENNADYLTDKVLKGITKDEPLTCQQVQKLIDEFLSEWTQHDIYYDGVDFDFIDKNNVLFVAVVVAKEN